MIKLCSPELVLKHTIEVIAEASAIIDIGQSYLDAYFTVLFERSAKEPDAGQIASRKAIRLLCDLTHKKLFDPTRRADAWSTHIEKLQGAAGLKEFRNTLAAPQDNQNA